MSLARKILGNTIAQVVGRFLTAAMAIVVVKILTVYLGQSGYGQYATIYEFLALFGAFADFGIFTIAVREMSRKKEEEEEIFGNALTLRTFFTAGAMLCGAGIAFLIPQYQGTVIPFGIAIAAISTFFVIASGTLSVVLQIRLRMEFAALALVIGKVFTVFLIIFLTQILYPEATETSFYWLIFSGLFGSVITFFLTFFFSQRVFPIRFQYCWEQVKNLLIEAAPFAIALALNTLYIRMDILFLSLLLPVSDNGACSVQFCGDTEAGLYAVGARILEIFLMVPLYFMNSVLPSLTRFISGAKEELFHLLHNSFLFLFSVGLPVGILLFLLSREIVGIISSDAFLSSSHSFGADTALIILSFFIPLAFCSFFFSFLLIASGRQSTLIWINLITVLFNISVDIWTIPQFGFVGAAVTSVIAECVMLSLMIFFSFRVVGFLPKKNDILRIILAASFSGILSWFAHDFLISGGRNIAFLGTGILFSVIYFGSLWRLKIITPEIIQVLRKKEI
jgi:O-antigen/teichoic acid export membrane protein